MKQYLIIIFILFGYQLKAQRVQEIYMNGKVYEIERSIFRYNQNSIDTVEKKIAFNKKIKSIEIKEYTLKFGNPSENGYLISLKKFNKNGELIYRSGDDKEIQYLYNSSGNIVDILSKDSYYKNTEHDVINFNNFGKINEMTVYFDSKLSEKYRFVYDEKGLLKEMRTQVTGAQIAGNLYNATKYLYNDRDLLMEESIYNSNLEFFSKISYQYDQKKCLIEKSMYSSTNLENKIVFNYDALGNKVSEIWYDRVGNVSPASQSNYKYDSSGNLIEQKFIDPMGKTTATETYIYDENGQLFIYTSTSNNFVRTCQYKYNKNSLISEVTDVGNKIRKYFYEYFDETQNNLSTENKPTYLRTIEGDWGSDVNGFPMVIRIRKKSNELYQCEFYTAYKLYKKREVIISSSAELDIKGAGVYTHDEIKDIIFDTNSKTKYEYRRISIEECEKIMRGQNRVLFKEGMTYLNSKTIVPLQLLKND